MAYLPPILRKKWFCVLMLAAAFLAFASIFLLPEVVSTAWHLVHGNSARFRVLEIPVPDGWWAFTSKGTLIVQKMERSTNQDSEVIVNDLPLPAGEVYDYDKEKTLSVKRMLKEGYRLQEERMSHMAGEDCFCLFFSDVRDTRRIRITCDIPNYRLFLYFVGDHRYAPVFDSITQHILKRDSTRAD
jgi:hypothetical protein